jgi:3-hydroxybutyryl-CoA dehydratase
MTPTIEPQRFTVSAPDMHDMAPIFEDPNPIHLDPAAAEAAGFGHRVVNQGPTNVGYVVTALRRAFPGAEVREVRCRLAANVFGDQTVVAGGEVVETDGDRLTCQIWLDVEDGPRAVTGTATVVLAPEKRST